MLDPDLAGGNTGALINLFEEQLTAYKSRQSTPNEGEIPLPPEAAGAEIPVPPAGEPSEGATEDSPATEEGGADQ